MFWRDRLQGFIRCRRAYRAGEATIQSDGCARPEAEQGAHDGSELVAAPADTDEGYAWRSARRSQERIRRPDANGGGAPFGCRDSGYNALQGTTSSGTWLLASRGNGSSRRGATRGVSRRPQHRRARPLSGRLSEFALGTGSSFQSRLGLLWCRLFLRSSRPLEERVGAREAGRGQRLDRYREYRARRICSHERSARSHEGARRPHRRSAEAKPPGRRAGQDPGSRGRALVHAESTGRGLPMWPQRALERGRATCAGRFEEAKSDGVPREAPVTGYRFLDRRSGAHVDRARHQAANRETRNASLGQK